MYYKKIQIQLALRTKDTAAGANELPVAEQVEEFETIIDADHFYDEIPQDAAGTENLLGVYLYSTGDGVSYGLQCSPVLHPSPHDHSDTPKLIGGALRLSWVDADTGAEPFPVTYQFHQREIRVPDEGEPIPDDLETHAWLLLLKRLNASSSAEQLILVFFDPQGSGHSPDDPCDKHRQLYERLGAEGEDDDAYNDARLRYMMCLRRENERNH